MPTWKLKTTDETLFYHICAECNKTSEEGLIKGGWVLIRKDEPVSCNECTRKCALTARGLWGRADAERYAVCAACPDLADCPLKGRYYC